MNDVSRRARGSTRTPIGVVSRMRMRKPLTLITATIVVFTLLFVPVSFAQNAKLSASTANPSTGMVGSPIAPPAPAVQKGTPMESGDVIVKFKQDVVASSTANNVVSAIHAQVGATVVQTSTVMPGVQLVKLPAGASVDDAIAQYKSNPAVEGAWPNLTYTLAATPNDPYYASLQWGLKNTGQTVNGVTGTPGADINASAAWDTTTGSPSIIVAVADTGVKTDHPDLAANVGPGWDFIYNSPDPTPLNWIGSFHGTHVAGTIGAVTNNALGVAGVDWHVQIMPLQIFYTTGQSTTYLVAQAIAYAGQHGASIINLSLGGPVYDAFLYQTIQQSPLLLVCAAGNAGTNNDQTPFYPASYDLPNIISVAASDSNDNLASFSNYGATSVDLAAPGVNIASTYYQYDYGYGYWLESGTSMAAPHVSGVAGLVKSLNPGFGYAQLKSAILSNTNSKPAFTGKTVTGGRLDANLALSASSTFTGPAVSSWASGRLDLFVTGTDHQLWHRYWQNGWSAWEPLGGYLTSSPTAVSWGPGRIDIFARGGEGHTWHMWWQNGWGTWEDLGGQLLPGTGPAVSSWASGRLDLFAIGANDHNLWHRAWTGTSWANWEPLGGYLTSSPAAVSWGPGRIDIFARGGEGHTWHMWWQNGWGTWEDLGGQLLPGTGPAVSSWASGRLDLFVTGAGDSNLWHKRWQNGWSNWESLGGYLTSSPAAVSWGQGRIDIFARGSEGHTWHLWWQDGWGTWEDVGGQLL